jgi:uncharacterized membrane protein YvbJ
MFCSNCGKEIDDKAVVCVGCGVPITPKNAKPKMSGRMIAVAVLLSFTVLSNIGQAMQYGISVGYVLGSLAPIIVSLILMYLEYSKPTTTTTATQTFKVSENDTSTPPVILSQEEREKQKEAALEYKQKIQASMALLAIFFIGVIIVSALVILTSKN